MEVTSTPFSVIYDSFLSKVTDDMYMELNELDTYRLLERLLQNAIHKFEFPRFDIFDYEDFVKIVNVKIVKIRDQPKIIIIIQITINY